MRLVRRILLTFLALVFLIEAWLWEHLGPVVRAIVAVLPFRALKARLAAAIERLPPWPSLVLFAVPGALLFPFKLAAFWFMARGQVVLGGLVFSAAKIVGFGLTAFIFETTKPKLMQLSWFARAHAWCLWAKDWAHGLVDPHMAWIKRRLAFLKRERRARLGAVLGRLRQRLARRRSAPNG
jgi:hypothetical protein